MVEKRRKIKTLEERLVNPDIWKNLKEATSLQQELSELKEESSKFIALEQELLDLQELSLTEAADESFWAELEQRVAEIEKKLEQEELRVFLTGRYDKGSATLSIYAGAGGQDAQDWAAMLLRMYERYCIYKNWKTKILHRSFGTASPDGQIGIKSATLEIRGPYVYGFLKGESGVHRLVRISPFSAQKLRHTSFALVEVLPEFSRDIEKEIEIKPGDLRVDTFRASGPGGQYVNRRESAVRITHLPTGITVSCQSERLQGQNRNKAMELLYAKLYQIKMEESRKEKAALRQSQGGAKSASWGNQIRSYVLHPYRMVKDLRTKVETSDVEGVLDGNLDEFVEAQVKI